MDGRHPPNVSECCPGPLAGGCPVCGYIGPLLWLGHLLLRISLGRNIAMLNKISVLLSFSVDIHKSRNEISGLR